LPIVIDTGASVSLTPNHSDFVGPIRETDISEMQGLSSTSKVAGKGKVKWTVRDLFGRTKTIFTEAYYVPDVTIRLFSPQVYFRTNDRGELKVNKAGAFLHFDAGDSPLEFPFQPNNILMMLPGIEQIQAGLSFEDVFYLQDTKSTTDLIQQISVADEQNQNLTAAEKELLLRHFRLGHANFQWIQSLMAHPRDGSPQILPCRHRGAATTTRKILCAACEVSKARAQRPPAPRFAPPDHNGMAIRAEDLHPGDKVSIDNYVSSHPGRRPNTFGKETKKDMFQGGTIFVDHASSLIFITHQILLKVGECLQSKRHFERWAKDHNVPRIRSYRADNMPFNAAAFREDLKLQNQTIDFSGVGAHFQNGVAERAITNRHFLGPHDDSASNNSLA
jgi:hypothetical protein